VKKKNGRKYDKKKKERTKKESKERKEKNETCLFYTQLASHPVPL